jgi:hypothetical protein
MSMTTSPSLCDEITDKSISMVDKALGLACDRDELSENVEWLSRRSTLLRGVPDVVNQAVKHILENTVDDQDSHYLKLDRFTLGVAAWNATGFEWKMADKYNGSPLPHAACQISRKYKSESAFSPKFDFVCSSNSTKHLQELAKSSIDGRSCFLIHVAPSSSWRPTAEQGVTVKSFELVMSETCSQRSKKQLLQDIDESLQMQDQAMIPIFRLRVECTGHSTRGSANPEHPEPEDWKPFREAVECTVSPNGPQVVVHGTDDHYLSEAVSI